MAASPGNTASVVAASVVAASVSNMMPGSGAAGGSAGGGGVGVGGLGRLERQGELRGRRRSRIDEDAEMTTALVLTAGRRRCCLAGLPHRSGWAMAPREPACIAYV